MPSPCKAPARACLGLVLLWAAAAATAAFGWQLADAEAGVLAGAGHAPDRRLAAALVLTALAVVGAVVAATTVHLTHLVVARLRGSASQPRSRLVSAVLLGLLGPGVVPPALATAEVAPAGTRAVLDGLPLPERQVDRDPRGTSTGERRDPRVWTVVRPGDTLWRLAARRLGPGADDAEVDRAWRALHAANRNRVGPDPDLIRPGTRLHVPSPLRLEARA